MAPSGRLPAAAGIGLKQAHLDELLEDGQRPAFVEIHAENYMGAGGAPHAGLARVRALMPVSLHGVGLSLGGEDAPDEAHLDRLAGLIARYQPASFSEHLAWSSHGGNYFNDLLPVAYDEACLGRVCEHVDRVQSRLGMRMLLENPATYVEFAASTMTEQEFIAEVIARTGCGLLLDVNNVYVSSRNHGRDPWTELRAMPLSAAGQIHLAGHGHDHDGVAEVLIDDHGCRIADPVWELYARTLALTGPVATLIEWDNNVPGYPVLREEALRAGRLLAACEPSGLPTGGSV